MFAADPIRTALRDGWTDGRMDGCLSADCALPGFCNLLTKPIVRWELCKVPTLPFPSLPFPSLPFPSDGDRPLLLHHHRRSVER